MLMVQTNMGLIPEKDYYDITAIQAGFDDYTDMQSQGYAIDSPETVEVNTN